MSGDAWDLTGRAVGHTYGGGLPALDGVDVAVPPGITALVGVNGAGKSTLMAILAGALKPSRGEVIAGAVDLYGWGRADALRRIALMPQSLTLPGNLTTSEALSVIASARGVTRRRIPQAVAEALEAVQLSARADDRVRSLSGGMKRRLCLAQALVSDPIVLLLDEPTTGLDPEQRRAMIDLVAGLRANVLMSSHIMEDVAEVAQRVVVLDAGRVAFAGSMGQMLERAPADLTTAERRAEAAFLSIVMARRAESSP